nr:entericidin A/B family lipoprotein [uncultured Acinetobacter sp.]
MKTLLTTLAIASVIVFTGCNTIKGAGQDVSKAGHAVSNTAEKTQDKIRK